MPYADLDQLIRDYLPEAKSTNERASVSNILDGVSSFVDSYCKRLPGFFTASPNLPAVKRVRGEGERFLRLPVHVIGSVTQLTFYEQIIPTTDYYESDKNGWIYLENNGFSSERTFLEAGTNRWFFDAPYKVTARWGYAETPKDLQEAVRQTVARWYETQKGTLGQITPNGFVIERDLPKSAKLILDNYKKREFEV